MLPRALTGIRGASIQANQMGVWARLMQPRACRGCDITLALATQLETLALQPTTLSKRASRHAKATNIGLSRDWRQAGPSPRAKRAGLDTAQGETKTQTTKKLLFVCVRVFVWILVSKGAETSAVRIRYSRRHLQPKTKLC